MFIQIYWFQQVRVPNQRAGLQERKNHLIWFTTPSDFLQKQKHHLIYFVGLNRNKARDQNLPPVRFSQIPVLTGSCTKSQSMSSEGKKTFNFVCSTIWLSCNRTPFDLFCRSWVEMKHEIKVKISVWLYAQCIFPTKRRAFFFFISVTADCWLGLLQSWQLGLRNEPAQVQCTCRLTCLQSIIFHDLWKNNLLSLNIKT